jgi:glycosyltransferase involved in cell wall biosynthesis
LVCVGGSPDSADTHALAETIGAIEPAIAQRIQLVHGISDEALKSIYRNVGVCASMSQHEGFGVPLVDALVFDKPLVINSEAGMMETVGDAAIVVNASSPEAVAKALGSALNDTAVRKRLASARRARLAVLRQLADGHLILDAVNRARTLHRARIV